MDQTRVTIMLIEENADYLEHFLNYLDKSDLSNQAMQNYYKAVKYYLNDYLAKVELVKAVNGYPYLEKFFGTFLIHRTGTTTEESIKASVQGIKLFYKSLVEENQMSLELYNKIVDLLEGGKMGWIKELRVFNEYRSTMN